MTSTSAFWLFQKASKTDPRKPHEINGRISPIRLFHKLYIQEQAGRQSICCKADEHRTKASASHKG